MAFIEAQGTTFFWSTNASTLDLLTTVAGSIVGQVVAINGPSGSAGKIDVTNLGSTAKEFIMGLRDEGDISLDIIYDAADAGHVTLFADRGTRTQRTWGFKLGDASSNFVKGHGYCTGFAFTGAVDDAIKATVTIALTGAVFISTGTTVTQAG